MLKTLFSPSSVMEKMRSPGDRLVFLLFLLPSALLIGTFTVFPILYVFFLSINDMRFVIDDPKFYGLENFRWLASNPFFAQTTLHTAIFTILSLAGQTTLGIFFAVMLNKEHLPGRELFRSIILFAWVIPEVVVAVIFSVIFGSNIGIINHILQSFGFPDVAWLNSPSISLYTLIIVNIWKGLPFNILVYLTAMQSVSKDWYEAAELDGANGWQKFMAITLPAIQPTLGTTLLLGTIWTSGVFFIPFIMTDGGPLNSTTLWSLAIYNTFYKNSQLSRAAAMSVFIYLVLFSLGWIYFKVLRRPNENFE